MPQRHPLLTAADGWADANAGLLAACFKRFEAEVSWPTLEDLQRDFELAEQDVDVAATAWKMPQALGFVENARLVLLVRGLSNVPAAGPLLEDWRTVLHVAYQRWRDDSQARLTYDDVLDLMGRDRLRADSLSVLLERERWAFGSGVGGPMEWSYEIASGVRAARSAKSAADVIAARNAIEFPASENPEAAAIAAAEPRGAETPAADAWRVITHLLHAPTQYLRREGKSVGDLIVIGVVATAIGSVAAAVVLLTLGVGGVGGVGEGSGGSTSTPTNTARPSQRTGSEKQAIVTARPGDGRDPKQSGCAPPANDVAGTKVPLAGHGLSFGSLVLRHSPACNTAWGMVRGLGPEEKLRLVIIANRPHDYATTGYAQFGKFNVEGVNGNELSQARGCVRAIAVIEHNGAKLASAKTPCR